MVSKQVTVVNETGLHARPAANFTKLASAQRCNVYLKKEDKKVNAKSILGILSLAISKGSVIEIITDGEEEKLALTELVDYVNALTD
jgi:phosphotransferase system HPr (HPr) family protein